MTLIGGGIREVAVDVCALWFLDLSSWLLHRHGPSKPVVKHSDQDALIFLVVIEVISGSHPRVSSHNLSQTGLKGDENPKQEF